MRRFSVIVPLLGPRDRFEDTLASILRHRPVEANVIVVHDGSYGDPYHLADEVQFVEADEDSGLIGFLNVGLCYAAGEFTVLTRPGIELDENWEQGIINAMNDESVAAVTPVITGSGTNRIVSAGVSADATGTRILVGNGKRNSRRSLKTLRSDGPSLWLGAYRTSVLKSLAPLDESLHETFVDLDIALSMRTLGFTTVVDSEFTGSVERSQWLVAESRSAHGESAQRASHRYSKIVRSATASSMVADLIRAPLASWRLKHAVERLAAAKWTDHDLKFANRLKRLFAEKPWVKKESVEHFSYKRAA